MLSGLSLSTTLSVGTADAGSYFNNEVLGAVDYGVSAFITDSGSFNDYGSRWPTSTRGLPTLVPRMLQGGQQISSRTSILVPPAEYPIIRR
jgi:hypothetical protein